MTNSTVDVNFMLTKISNHIYLGEIKPFFGFNFTLCSDSYISLVATSETCFFTSSNDLSYEVDERKSILLSLNKGHNFEIRSLKMDCSCLVIVTERAFIDQLNVEEKNFTSLIQTFHPQFIDDAAIYPIALEILMENIPSMLKNLHQKSKVLELFSKQLLFIQQLEEETTIKIRRSDMEKVREAKFLIDENIAHTYTIPELSRIIGTNEQYLKKHFKYMYGLTIHSYILKNKMNFAKELLLTGDDKIADIATKIGYKHATHFTTAFKKHFGFLPNSLRYEIIAYLSTYSLDYLSII